MKDLAPETPIAQQRRDLRVASKAPEAILLPEKDRRRRANSAISGIRIVEKNGVARIERHAALFDVDFHIHGAPDARRS